jgi:hypothetical protein
VDTKIETVASTGYRRIVEASGEVPGTKGKGFSEYQFFFSFLIPKKNLGDAIKFFVGQHRYQIIPIVLNLKGLPRLNPEIPHPFRKGKSVGPMDR